MASNGDNDATLLNITLELGGGTEFLTSTKKTKKHSLKVPARVAPNELAKVEPVALAGVIDGSNTKDTTKTAPSAITKHATTMQDFVQFVCRELITERHSMLVEPDGSMRPGILVLINDADWELEGEMEYELQDGDHICFISTLHGTYN